MVVETYPLMAELQYQAPRFILWIGVAPMF
jgi:hypothetical protein